MKYLRLMFMADTFWQSIWKTIVFIIVVSCFLFGLVEWAFFPNIDYINNPTHPFPVIREIVTMIIPFSYFSTFLQHKFLSRHTGFKAFTDYVLFMAIMLTPLFFFMSFFKN